MEKVEERVAEEEISASDDQNKKTVPETEPVLQPQQKSTTISEFQPQQQPESALKVDGKVVVKKLESDRKVLTALGSNGSQPIVAKPNASLVHNTATFAAGLSK